MKQIILFGTGEIAHDFLHFLGREKIAYFVDNNMEKVGSNIEGIEIISFKKLIEIHQNYELIIAVGAEYTPEIAKQLSKNSIVFSSRYDFPYYMIAGEKHYVSVEKIIENNKLLARDNFCIWGDNCFSKELCRCLNLYNKHVKVINCTDELSKVECGNLLQQYSTHILCVCNRNPIIGEEKTEQIRSWIIENNDITVIDCYAQDIFEKAFYSPHIEEFKDKYRGKRCFIIGNGPSLKASDLEVLHENNEITFASNKIYKIFDQTKWRPTFYCCTDNLFIRQKWDQIKFVECKYKFIYDIYNENKDVQLVEDSSIKYVHVECMEYEKTMPYFSEDASKTTYMGYTVTYIAMQLAYYMGFSEVYLLGVDNSFGPNNIKNSHFVKDYLEENEIHYVVPASKPELAYKRARLAYERQGRTIYNATRGGVLEVFKRVDFDEIIN